MDGWMDGKIRKKQNQKTTTTIIKYLIYLFIEIKWLTLIFIYLFISLNKINFKYFFKFFFLNKPTINYKMKLKINESNVDRLKYIYLLSNIIIR